MAAKENDTQPQKVLITGISGFVGAHVAKSFLDHGWEVIGTVRSAQKGNSLLALPAFSQSAKDGKIKFTVVEDISKADFNQVLKGVDALAHTASPFHFDGKTFSDYADPAIEGTLNILKAAQASPQIKAVVVTSSFVSVVDHTLPPEKQGGKVYSEADWLPITYEAADASSDSALWYCASKKLAEEAAWAIKKEGANWTLATICPPMIFGPVIHTGNLLGLNESSRQLYDLFSGKTGGEVPPTRFPCLSDVRDVAETHYQAISRMATGRFIVASGVYDNQRIVDTIRKSFPAASDQVPNGRPGKHYRPEEVYALDSSKAKRELGIRIRQFDEIIVDTVQNYIDLEAQT
ncbi:methylglyoxal reductase (NADPH-dependent) gre2 [Puccinia graminis f. sp. tritici]|uniref:Methylglyoxal reductase (NADPH-dependent) gre2 n=1 Tax=Puccinia graminis f. sp. tritici TaxID=56615 RepID=A0A5B0RLK8_PUCGR|nr:methylglyoxal reductase (NADPH-dependent) gre2 [Puccinia graminis f. sp. tritici]KAA1125988.1 methylglyoxal reductase (NADPH-dependent) gre2 [Puccinia graminis f. sp. tritici]